MRILLLTITWFMLWFSSHLIAAKHPIGLEFNDLGDMITAFFYQPIIYILIAVVFLLTYSILFYMFHSIFIKFFLEKNMVKYSSLTEEIYTLFISILFYFYFPFMALCFYICIISWLILVMINYRRKGFSRFKKKLTITQQRRN